MRVVLLCIVVAHASALGRKKKNGPSLKVAAVLAVDKKAVAKGDALFKKRTAQSCDAAARTSLPASTRKNAGDGMTVNFCVLQE